MSHHKLFHLNTGFFEAGHIHIHPYAMGAQVLLCVTAFLVVFLSLERALARPSNNQNVTDFDSGKVIVKGNYNAVNLYPEKDVKTALSQLEKKIESLEGRLDALEKFKSGMSVF